MDKPHRTHPGSLAAQRDREIDKENTARLLRINQQAREAARGLINPSTVIQELMEIKMALQPIAIVDPDTHEPTGELEYPSKDAVMALKLKADINFKLLNKNLPDLKSVEVTGNVDHQHSHDITKISDVELAQRLTLWQRTQQTLADPDQNVIDITPVTQSEPTPTDEPELDFI